MLNIDPMLEALVRAHPERAERFGVRLPEPVLAPDCRPEPVYDPPFSAKALLKRAGQIAKAIARSTFGPREPKISEILDVVSRYYGVPVIDIASWRRTAHVMKPRMVACYLARTLTRESFPAIGMSLGGRDHTTIIHAYEKIRELIDCDEFLRKDVARIRRKLGCA